MADNPLPRFTDNPAIRGREGHYAELVVETARILGSWRESLFSYEWLRPDGGIKPMDELPPGEQTRRQAVEQQMNKGDALEKPVLGIGMLDNVEIGAGKAVFLTLAANGVTRIPVHVPVSHTAEFKKFLAGAPTPAGKKAPDRRKGESGNIVVYILMAIVVLAALVAAVARSGRQSVSYLTHDRQRLMATEIMEYGDAIAQATAQMRLRGIKFNQFSFASASLPSGYGTYNDAPTHEVFNPSGGGVNYKKPPAEAMQIPGDYAFVGANEANEVGKTCGDASCVDLMMVAGPLRSDVCAVLDTLLNIISSESSPPPSVTHIDASTLYAGTSTYSATIGGTPSTQNLDRKMAACVKDNGSGFYYYYQILQPQ